jgi:hypothetical protein
MATGALDANGVWIYGEDDSETTFSALLNKLGDSVSDALVSPGKVLQVVHATYSTAIINNTTTAVVTGLTATITPKFSTSKILVLVTQGGVQKSSGNAGSWLALWLRRNGTNLERQLGAYTGFSSDNYIGNMTFNYLDNAATTSPITYDTTFSNLVNAPSVQVQGSSSPSHITLIEIGA